MTLGTVAPQVRAGLLCRAGELKREEGRREEGEREGEGGRGWREGPAE